MKAQCVHSDTGMCETCFNYETRIFDLKARLDSIVLIANTMDEMNKVIRGIALDGIEKEEN